MLVQVYRNLAAKENKLSYSLVDVKTSRVVQVLPRVVLRNAEFRVSEAGRQRVLARQRKNVHAKVWGYWEPGLTEPAGNYKDVYYNPYVVSTFVLAEDRQTPVTSAEWVVLDQAGMHVLNPQSSALGRQYQKRWPNPASYLRANAVGTRRDQSHVVKLKTGQRGQQRCTRCGTVSGQGRGSALRASLCCLHAPEPTGWCAWCGEVTPEGQTFCNKRCYTEWLEDRRGI